MKQYEAFIQYGNAQNLPMRTIKAEAVIVSPLWYHKRGLMQTASGYGKKLVTEYKIKYNNSNRH